MPPPEPTHRSHRTYRGTMIAAVVSALAHPLADVATDSAWRLAVRLLCERAGWQRPVRVERFRHACCWARVTGHPWACAHGLRGLFRARS